MTSIRGTLLLSLAGLAAALAAGITLMALNHSKLGWWLILSGVIGSGVVAAAVIRGRRSLARLAQDESEARHSGRAGDGGLGSANAAEVVARSRRWVGSASVPGAMGYTEIGIFLAVAEVGAEVFTLRVRPAIIRVMFGIENLKAVPTEGTMIFPARKFGQMGLKSLRRKRR